MILEVADIRIAPGRQADFERAAHLGIQTVIAKSKGFCGYQVRHSIETPERYLLLLEWETLEDHTVGFRGSPAYAQWRSIVVDFLTAPPVVEHFTLERAVSPEPVGVVDGDRGKRAAARLRCPPPPPSTTCPQPSTTEDSKSEKERQQPDG